MQEIGRRPIEAEDESFLFALYAGTRDEEMGRTGWSAEEQEAFLRMQFRAQSTDYQRNYSEAEFLLLLDGDTAIGRLYLDRRQDEIRILDIALVASYRNRGIGSTLMAEILSEAEAAGKAVRIHVEQSNPAQRLYGRLGFEPIGENGVYFLMEWTPAAAARPS